MNLPQKNWSFWQGIKCILQNLSKLKYSKMLDESSRIGILCSVYTSGCTINYILSKVILARKFKDPYIEWKCQYKIGMTFY